MTPSVPSPVGDADKQRFGGASEKPRPPAGTEREVLERVIGEAIADGPLDIECPTCQARRHEPCMEVSGLGRRQRRDGPHVMRIARTVAAAVVSSPERDSATGLSRSDTNEASSPATPEGGRDVMLTRDGQRVVVLRGPDEDGLCGVEHLDRSGTSILAFSGLRPAPSTLPAETREGRERQWAQAMYGTFDRWTFAGTVGAERRATVARLMALADTEVALALAASPAVSLPGEEKKP